MKSIAIVILNWNGADMMRRFLPSVAQNTPEADVVVVDNGSMDDSISYLASEMPHVRRIVLDKNYGFAEGYHRGLAALDAECLEETGDAYAYYLLLNSDVEVRAGWVSPMLAYMEAHPEVAACQPKLLCQWNPDYFEYAGASGGFVDALGYPYCRGRVFGTVEKDCGQYDDVHPVLWATGAALLIRRADYWNVGGLDGRFFAHQEEIDLCWRLRSRGRGVVVVPQSVAYHLGGGTLPQGNPHKDYLNFRNNLLLLYKNLPEERLRTVFRIRLWLDALASLQFLLKGQWGSFRAVWCGRLDFRRMRPGFESDRAENLRQAVLVPVPEQSTFSLLWLYYVKGKKTFDKLKVES
ncbi:MAG: glycosyltransferase family 2 protein [Bacteroidaceae bacterium]|nr:glycosyltransferase family 2 protein [Bacteroidaceae bacterium]